MAGVGPDGVTGSTGTAGSGEATSPDGCRPKTVAGVGCADVAGLTGAADGAETGMVTGVAAGAVRAAGGISTSRGVGIAVVCAAALATATAASTGRVSGRRGIVRDDGYGRLCRGDNRLDLGNRLGTGLAGDTISLPLDSAAGSGDGDGGMHAEDGGRCGHHRLRCGHVAGGVRYFGFGWFGCGGRCGCARHTGMLRSRYCVYFVLMNGLIGGVARGAADIGRIARIGGMMRSFGRIQQVVLGMAIRRIWCLPQHAGKVGGRNHILHLTQPRVQVG